MMIWYFLYLKIVNLTVCELIGIIFFVGVDDSNALI